MIGRLLLSKLYNLFSFSKEPQVWERSSQAKRLDAWRVRTKFGSIFDFKLMTTGKPRVWVFPFAGNCDDYTLVDADAIPDVLTAKRVLELARPGLRFIFHHVYFMGVSKPLDDSYGVAAFSDEENMLDHAPGARDIYLRVANVPLSLHEMGLAMKDCSLAAHLFARPPCAPVTPKVQSELLLQ